MSQNVVNYGIDPSGAQLLDDLLSGEQQNRLTMDGGNSRPPYAEIGTIWTDKSVTGKATLKRFNGTSDDILMTIDETTGAITIPGIADTDLSNLSASGNSKFQAPLVSGTNIKTINGESILGSGDVTISAGANTDLSNLSATGNDKFVTKNTAQTISGVKTFSTSGTLKVHTPLLLKQSSTTEGGQIDFERGGSSVLSSNPYIDLNTNTIRVIGVSSQNALNITLKVDLENNQVLVPTPAANANDYQAANTYWCKTYIGAVDYSSGTDVTSSIFAASGTGYKPTKKGVLLIKAYSSFGYCDVYIYDANGTQVFTNRWNDAITTYTAAGGTMELLLDKNFSVRITTNAGTAGTNYWATFFPYA